jgi:DNA-binding transcriptional regulator of glucitol operon
VRRLLTSPKWLLGHLLVVVLAVAFCRLGWWQWDRYQQTHGRLQNLGYALQWPLFAVFGVAFWVRIARDAVFPERAAARAAARAEADSTARARRLARRMPAAPPPGTAVVPYRPDPEDDRLAAYNRYLASLYERDQEH